MLKNGNSLQASAQVATWHEHNSMLPAAGAPEETKEEESEVEVMEGDGGIDGWVRWAQADPPRYEPWGADDGGDGGAADDPAGPHAGEDDGGGADGAPHGGGWAGDDGTPADAGTDGGGAPDGGAPDGGGAPDATDGGPTAPWRGGAWKPKWRGSPGKGRGKGKGKGKGKPYRGNRGGRGRNEKKGTDKSGKGGNQKGNKRWWNYSDDAEESQHGTASPWEYV